MVITKVFVNYDFGFSFNNYYLLQNEQIIHWNALNLPIYK